MKAELSYMNWRDLDAHLVWIYSGAPVLQSGRFQSRDSSAWLMLKGELEIEGGAQTIGAGEWVFVPRKSHRRVFSSDAKIISVKFVLSWPDGRLLFEPSQVLSMPSVQCPKLERAVRALLKYVKKIQLEAGNAMHAQSLSLEEYLQSKQLFETWLMAYLEAMMALGMDAYLSRREDVRVVRAKRGLEQHPLHTPLDLRGIAGDVGLSLGHADTLFHQSYGQTMRAYYDVRRYTAACHWLSRTQMPIKEIAFNLAFKDAATFSHWFKRHAQRAPRHYREWATQKIG
ncbi:MAG TPA: hypothetical protein DEA90_14830 [Opitutae bacterium]|nr:hypothetical protein [Puniceicoccaceae bacterium]HBR95433.1 hypothetical protein [Opitutae bacterium]|tara:strand:+ start:1361 stop:2215 length:855 start_codon:yes stop_codon:yes gene_type:complete